MRTEVGETTLDGNLALSSKVEVARTDYRLILFMDIFAVETPSCAQGEPREDAYCVA